MLLGTCDLMRISNSGIAGSEGLGESNSPLVSGWKSWYSNPTGRNFNLALLCIPSSVTWASAPQALLVERGLAQWGGWKIWRASYTCSFLGLLNKNLYRLGLETWILKFVPDPQAASSSWPWVPHWKLLVSSLRSPSVLKSQDSEQSTNHPPPVSASPDCWGEGENGERWQEKISEMF